MRSERAGLDRAIEEIRGRHQELGARLAERGPESPNPFASSLRGRDEVLDRSATYELDLGL